MINPLNQSQSDSWPRLTVAFLLACLLHGFMLAGSLLGFTQLSHPRATPSLSASLRHTNQLSPLTAVTEFKLYWPQSALAPSPPSSAEQEKIVDNLVAWFTPLDWMDEFSLTYYDATQVDIRAEPITEVILHYPDKARHLGIQGKVQLMLLINERGGVDEISVEHAAPPGLFDEAAMEAFKKTQFSPAQKNGHFVRSKKQIEVVFDLEKVDAVSRMQVH